jgi:hypothetical protein
MKPAAFLVLFLALLAPALATPARAADPETAAPAAKPVKAAKAAKPARAPAGPPRPTGACYSKDEFLAEQGIRYHTELMVIGLTCREASAPGQDLFADYKRVTLAYRDVIVGWERALIAHFKRTGAANPTRSLDNFRTAMANENARRIAAVTTPVYCQTHVPMLARALSMSAVEAKRELEEAKIVQIAAEQRCDMPIVP